MSSFRRVVFASAIFASLLQASEVYAGGLELLPGGTHSVGRGGAIYARPSNPMAVLQNPAGLTEIAGDQVTLGFDIPFHDMCVEPYGYYGWGVYLPDERGGALLSQDARRSEFGDPASAEYGNRRLDTICNSAPVGPIPQTAFSFHLTERLSIGFGFTAPVLVPGLQFGGKDGTIAVDGGARPTPTRYQLIHSEFLFGLSGNGGIAFKVMPELSIGLGVQVGAGNARQHAVMALNAGTSPAEDMYVTVEASDYFVPSLVLAVHAKPHPRLTLMGSFTWSDGVRGSGEVIFTTNTYHQGANGSEFVPLQNDPIRLRSVRVESPWNATIGVRYAQPLPGARSTDPFEAEMWDVEVDATYTFLAHNGDSNAIDIAGDVVVEAARANGLPQEALRVDEDRVEGFTVESHALSSLAVRLGGSWNVMPGKFGLLAGGFLETRGLEPAYASVDSFAFGRVGLSLGVQMRFGSFDLSAAYAHIFQEEITVAPPPHEPRQDANDDPTSGFDQRVYEDGELSDGPKSDRSAPSPSEADAVASWQQPALFESADRRARVVNAGRYTASFDVVSVAFAYRF